MKDIAFGFVFACLTMPAYAQQQAPHTQHAPPMAPSGFVLKQITDTLPKGDQLEVRVMTSTLQPGAVGSWHTHPAPPTVYVLEGTFSLEVKDQETMHAKAGEAILEPINTAVRATNKGQTPVKLVIFQVSAPDVPLSHPAPQH